MSAPTCLPRDNTTHQNNLLQVTQFRFWYHLPALHTLNMDMEMDFLYDGLNLWEQEWQHPLPEDSWFAAQQPFSRDGGEALPLVGDEDDLRLGEGLLFAALGRSFGVDDTIIEDENLFDELLDGKIDSELVDEFINSPEFAEVDKFIDSPEFASVLRDLEYSEANDNMSSDDEQGQIVPEQRLQQTPHVSDDSLHGHVKAASEADTDEDSSTGDSSDATTAEAARPAESATATPDPSFIPDTIYIPTTTTTTTTNLPEGELLQSTITIFVDANGSILKIDQSSDLLFLQVASSDGAPTVVPPMIDPPSVVSPATVNSKTTIDLAAIPSTSRVEPSSSPKAKRTRTRKSKPYQRPPSSNKSSSWEEEGDDDRCDTSSQSSYSSSSSTAGRGREAADRPPRKERKRGQNRTAANRYRQKKKAQTDALEIEMEGLTEVNKELTGKVDQLSNEIGYLKGLMKDILVSKGLVKK